MRNQSPRVLLTLYERAGCHLCEDMLLTLLEFRDEILPNLHRQLDALTENVRDVANAAHNRGSGLPGANSLGVHWQLD